MALTCFHLALSRGLAWLCRAWLRAGRRVGGEPFLRVAVHVGLADMYGVEVVQEPGDGRPAVVQAGLSKAFGSRPRSALKAALRSSGFLVVIASAS